MTQTSAVDANNNAREKEKQMFSKKTTHQVYSERFSKIYEKTIQLQRRGYGPEWDQRDFQQSFDRYMKFLHVELVEAQQLTNFKDHKKAHQIDVNSLREEIVDILLYTLNLSGLVFDNGDDLLDVVEWKMDKNTKRTDWKR